MNRLFLFTTNFPYGQGEEFLETEIIFLAKHFSKVTVIPMVRSVKSGIRPVPCNVEYTEPLINCNLGQKMRLLLIGLLNNAPILFALQEFINKKVYRDFQWVLNWLSYTSLTRAGLSSSRFKALITEIQPTDLLYFYWADNASNLIPFLRKRFVNKIVVRFHRGDLYEEMKGNYLPYRQQLLQSIDLAVFISKHGQDYLEKRYPFQLKRSTISRLGVINFGNSRPGDGSTLFLVSCSGVSKVKRVHMIPLALKSVNFKVHWTHFGTGPLFSGLQEISENLPKNITTSLRGHINNNDILSYYNEYPVDLFINVSESEGLPVSIMEAMSFGIPVMATNVGGVSEIVSNNNGYLIQGDLTVELLVEYLKQFYLRNDKTVLRANAKQTWAIKHDAEANYEQFCQIIKMVD